MNAIRLIAVMLLASLPTFGKVTLVQHVAVQAPRGGGKVTTPVADFSACTVAAHCMIGVWSVSLTAKLPAAPISDSQGNHYTLAKNATQTVSFVGASDPTYTLQLWITYGGSTSRSMTFTYTGRETYEAIAVAAFNGVASGPDKINSAAYKDKGSRQGTGAVMPTRDNELVFTALGVILEPGFSLKSPFATLDNINWTGGSGAGIVDGYQLQTTATAANPTWQPSPATGMSGGSAVATFFSVETPGPLSLSTTSLPEGFKGIAYSTSLQANGGVTPYTWSQAAGTLPTGLRLNTSAGAISGTPTQTTLNTTATFQVTDAKNNTASTSRLTITIAASALSITTTTCPSGRQYASYSGCTIAATGGTAPYTFSCSTSNNYAWLPAGMALNSSTGIVSSSLIGGQGTYKVQFIVTDAESATATQFISLGLQGSNAFLSSIFPANSIFHHRIDAATTGLPVDTSPAAPILAAYRSHTLAAFFGPSVVNGYYPNGIPAIKVPCSQTKVPVRTSRFQHYFTSGPIPPYSPIEGSQSQSAQYPVYYNDAHSLVYVEAGCGNPPALYELNVAFPISGGTSWADYSNALWSDVTSNALTPQGRGTSDAAGLPIAPLLVNADDVIGTGTPSAPNGIIQHPIRFTVNHMLSNWVWPATATAGVSGCTGVPPFTQISQSSPPAGPCSQTGPAGEIYRLKASVSTPSCAATSPQSAIIITALRNYGIILADNGLTGGLIGTPDTRWNSTDLSCLQHLTLSNFEPVNVSSLIVSNDSGQTK